MMEALDLLIATDELLLTELSDHVQEYLLHYEVGWLEDNLITLWRKINQYESCRKLQEYCLSLICKDPNFLFKSPDFLSLDSSLLVPFLKLDNLQIGEVQIWNYLIEWGLARNENLLVENISQWTKEDFDQLGTTLKECIPLIGFSQINSSDFFDKVWPFRDILPKDTLEDVMRYHLKPTTSPKSIDKLAKRLQFDSGLLRQCHAALLCSWIDILGQKRGMIEDGRLCRVSRHRSCYAIRFNGRDYGPCFGDKDLSMKGKFDQEGSCSCQKDDYFDKVTDTGSFKVDEYEVFKIVKK
ncbi:10088_t:CDS:2 [Funneliformis caledonium]|uniref:10088_t:CDS:1 n=1 Tax=Funneliformis caledonium TaxID=1117310 RepID=A0A9N8V8Q8_9GLOM|nr:10088_t:CDS:2 [Funneliformis caledonium]